MLETRFKVVFLLAVLFAASLPMGILQASGAQNDLVASFWLVCVAVFALRLMKPGAGKPADALLFAISLGLALLTKATLRMYALPFVVWVAVWMLRRARLSAIPKLAGIACVVILINAPFVSRNYSLFGAALMPPARVGNFTNAVVTPGVVVSNVLRNVALHFGAPRADLNRQFIAQPVIAIHQALGLVVADGKARGAKGHAYGSVGVGHTGHIWSELLAGEKQFEASHAPYKGTGPLVLDLVAGRLDWAFLSTAEALTRTGDQSVKALSVTGPARVKQMANVPTMRELGYGGFEMVGWHGLFAPAGTPKGVVAKIEAEVRAALNDPDIQTTGLGSEDFGKLMRADQARWAAHIKRFNIQAE
jgi:hypothetical protein